MKPLEKRLSAVEARQPPDASGRPRKRFLTWEKPGIDPREDLRAQGHDVQDGDIIRIIVEAPLRDDHGNLIGAADVVPFPGSRAMT